MNLKFLQGLWYIPEPSGWPSTMIIGRNQRLVYLENFLRSHEPRLFLANTEVSTSEKKLMAHSGLHNERCYGDNFSRDVSTIWLQARNACRLLNQTKMGVRFQWSETRNELTLYMDTPYNPIEQVIITEWAQGKGYRNTVHLAASNHLIEKDTRFCNYWLVFRAWLEMVPLNDTRRFDNGAKQCWKCGNKSESLPEVAKLL